ncbi:hypothetical protein DESA109040_15170 [Deinococcus saxicola]|uniref:hypothetical protein n=1 Tax=Deinococcus saxicola TaxID=249406 RepID=UPI0039F06AB1
MSAGKPVKYHQNQMCRGRADQPDAAGTFDVWQVRGNLRVVGKLGPVRLNRDLGEFEEWYAEGVGLVKSSSSYTDSD